MTTTEAGVHKDERSRGARFAKARELIEKVELLLDVEEGADSYDLRLARALIESLLDVLRTLEKRAG